MGIGTKEFDSGVIPTALATTDDMLLLDNLDAAKIAIELIVAGNALDAFEIQGKLHSSGAFVPITTVAADYTTPSGIVLKASRDLVTSPIGTHWLLLQNLETFQALKFRASSAVGAGSLHLRGIIFPKS